MPESSLPVFGPLTAARPGPLGKEIRLRIHLDGCRGLPQPKTPAESYAPRKFFVSIGYISSRDGGNFVDSSSVHEGTGCLQGTVKWDDILDITCLEHSLLRIILYHGERNGPWECVSTAGDLLQVSSVSLVLWDDTISECTLFISASAAPADCDKDCCELDTASRMVFERDDARFELQSPASSWDVAFRGLFSFGGAVSRHNIADAANNIFYAQFYTYISYQACCTRQSNDAQTDSLLKSLMKAVSTCVQVQSTRVLQSKDCVEQIYVQLYYLAFSMQGNASYRNSDLNKYREEELARLVVILVTPDPPTGVNSTSTSTDWAALYGTTAKDALLLTLEGIVQSSDAFPPLKSAASGLLFFATSADMASSNKKQIRDIHKRVNSLAASLRCGAEDGSMLSSAHHNAIGVLAADISALKEDLESIVHERKSRFRRFFSAKRHREELQDIVQQMDHARLNYTTAVATLNATTNAQVLAHISPEECIHEHRLIRYGLDNSFDQRKRKRRTRYDGGISGRDAGYAAFRDFVSIESVEKAPGQGTQLKAFPVRLEYLEPQYL
ncbi:unnamed protein product [Peniophora sp. CBMAI 1063]|nr:unnamed protein product [Peniophora sp. CBMAI 1063]